MRSRWPPTRATSQPPFATHRAYMCREHGASVYTYYSRPLGVPPPSLRGPSRCQHILGRDRDRDGDQATATIAADRSIGFAEDKASLMEDCNSEDDDHAGTN